MLQQICYRDVVMEAANEVFETMIFMDLEPCDIPDVRIENDALLSSITFKGELEGCFSIAANTDCAKTIAMNMLGLDDIDEVSDDEACDAMGEVANMIMGSIKTRIHEACGDVEVSIPSVVAGKELKNSLGENAEKVMTVVTIDEENIAEMCLIFRPKKA